MPNESSARISAAIAPDDAEATLVARVWVPGEGPSVAAIRGTELVDVTAAIGPTMSDLLDRTDPATAVIGASPTRAWDLDEVISASLTRDEGAVRLLSPFDLSALKAAGVTFARSMVERVIEEAAKGEPGKARNLREHLGDDMKRAAGVVPGSEEAARIKERLQSEGLWSQYLEVGIGPDPEIFTKGQPLSSVGLGAQIGVLARSVWNNPEPEVVLAVSSAGVPVGATLGNDVNLRDFEGRSALLLAEAKDNNASCAMGPFIRLFDSSFSIERLKTVEVSLTITGEDGFELSAVSKVAEMSRSFEELVGHAWGRHHQYPDGFALMTGTMFAPTEDRDGPGQGFTHHAGDIVSISVPELGTLRNVVGTSEAAPEWLFGVRSMMDNLAGRGLLA